MALMVATVYLFTLVPKGFLPSEDQGRFNVNTEGARASASMRWFAHQLQVADDLLKDPNIASAGVNVGQMGNNAPAARTGPHVRRVETTGGAQKSASIR